MRSEMFTGKDAADVRQRVWTWRKKHPQFFVIKQHPIEGIVPTSILLDLVKRSKPKNTCQCALTIRTEFDPGCVKTQKIEARRE